MSELRESDSRPAAHGTASESLDDDDTTVTPSVRLRKPRPLSEFARLRRPRAVYKAGRRRAASSGAQTALDCGMTDPNVVTVELGERFSAWAAPASIVDDLRRLEIPYQWHHEWHAWALPKARVSDLLASLDADGRRVVVVEVTGR